MPPPVDLSYDEQVAVAGRIVHLRQQRRWSRGDLADALDVSLEAVGYWERHTRMPSASMLFRIARTFDVSVEFIWSGQGGQSS